MLKKTIAIILCLALTLLACACAASDVTVSAPENTDSKGGNTPDLSTMEQPGTSTPASQMSSQPILSDTVSKPTEPILPEEKETTLEKVLSFEIGMDGLFEYGFLYYDDPATAIPSVNGYMYTDGEGEFYQVFAGARVVRLSDGAMLPILHQDDICDIAICGTSFFVLCNDDIVYEYDIVNGFENATLAKKYLIPNDTDAYVSFGHLLDGRPTIQYQITDGTHWYFDDPLYTLEKTQLKDSELLYTYVDSLRDGASIQAIDGKIKGWAIDKNGYAVLSATAEKIVLLEKTGSADAKVYVSYDRNGNILSRYTVHSRTYYSEEKGKPCEIEFSAGGKVFTLKEYRPQTLMIDDILFDDLVYDHFFVAPSGEMYFAAYYLDHCDVYRINPGYSDRDYVTEWQKNEAEDSNIAPTSDASDSSASSVYFLDIKRDEAKANALEMINLGWDILPGNLDVRPNTELPHYLDINHPDTSYVDFEQTGIPYCRGGYNTGETFVTDAETIHSNGKRHMTGNVAAGNIQSQTLGLDCMRFLCASFGFEEGLAPWQFREYFLEVGCGHEVDSITELEEMDVIISASHAMFFKRISPTGIVEVYDVTSTVYYAKTRERSTGYTPDQLIAQGYHFYHVYPGIDYSTTQHWIACDSCGEYPQNYENHTISYKYDPTYHWEYCTDGCGYVSVRKRAHTMQYGACSVCGYNTNNLQTRPGTEVVLEQ